MVGAWERMHRREVLRMAALGAMSAGLVPLLGCGSGSDAASPYVSVSGPSSVASTRPTMLAPSVSPARGA